MKPTYPTLALVAILALLPTVFSEIQVTGTLTWDGTYDTGECEFDDCCGHYTWTQARVADPEVSVGFSLDAASTDIDLSGDDCDGSVSYTLSNTPGEWWGDVAIYLTPHIPYGNEYSHISQYVSCRYLLEDPGAYNAQYCYQCDEPEDTFMAADAKMRCDRVSVTATSSDTSVVTVSVGSVVDNIVELFETYADWIWTFHSGYVLYEQEDPNYNTQDQEITFTGQGEGTAEVQITATYACNGGVWCWYQVDEGGVRCVDKERSVNIPRKELTLTMDLDVTVDCGEEPNVTEVHINLNQPCYYDDGQGGYYLDNLTCEIDAVDYNPGGIIDDYDFAWYYVLPNTPNLVEITDGTFITNGNEQTLVEYADGDNATTGFFQTGTLIYCYGRAHSNWGLWSDWVSNYSSLNYCPGGPGDNCPNGTLEPGEECEIDIPCTQPDEECNLSTCLCDEIQECELEDGIYLPGETCDNDDDCAGYPDAPECSSTTCTCTGTGNGGPETDNCTVIPCCFGYSFICSPTSCPDSTKVCDVDTSEFRDCDCMPWDDSTPYAFNTSYAGEFWCYYPDEQVTSEDLIFVDLSLVASEVYYGTPPLVDWVSFELVPNSESDGCDLVDFAPITPTPEIYHGRQNVVGTVSVQPKPGQTCTFEVLALAADGTEVTTLCYLMGEMEPVCPTCVVTEIPSIVHPIGAYSGSVSDAQSKYDTAVAAVAALLAECGGDCDDYPEVSNLYDNAKLHLDAAEVYLSGCGSDGEPTCRLSQYYSTRATNLAAEGSSLLV